MQHSAKAGAHFKPRPEARLSMVGVFRVLQCGSWMLGQSLRYDDAHSGPVNGALVVQY
jgi:hypothetical protein